MKVIETLYCRWFLRRHGCVRALKPPLGWHRVYARRPWWWLALYRMRYARYRLACWFFNRYGGPVRDQWDAQFFAKK